jgi:hypothetical protein
LIKNPHLKKMRVFLTDNFLFFRKKGQKTEYRKYSLQKQEIRKTI